MTPETIEHARRIIKLAAASSSAPWTTDPSGPGIYSDTVWLIDCDCDGASIQQDKDNAAFIIEARNHGPDICRALIEAQDRVRVLEAAASNAALQIEYLHGKFQETGSGNAALAQLSAALAPQPEQKE